MEEEVKSYLGTGWAFPPSFVKNSGVEMVSNDDDIKQSLNILFSTRIGERIFRFDYGSNIHQFVFGEMNLSNKTLLIDHIKQSILYFEPRIIVNNVFIESDNQIEGCLYITVNYTIRLTNNRGNMVYPFYFKEGTNL